MALHATVLAIAGLGAQAHRRLRPRSPRLAEAVIPMGTALGWAVIHFNERRRPFDPAWRPGRAEVRADLAFLTLTSLPVGLGTVLGSRIARRVGRRADLGRLPTPVAVGLSLAAHELFHTCYHRLAHEWGPAWKLHAVHHSPERLYWLNATRFHLAEMLIESTAENAVVPLLGLQPHQHVAHQLVRSVYGQLQHANVATDSGPLNRIFATPDLHRWHHSEIYEQGDTNYGAVLSIWDQLLGSWFWPGRQLDSPIGVGRMPVFPSTWGALQRVPLDWERIKADNAATWLATTNERTSARRR